ncbi:hypothetical protein B0H14DRAFT_2614059 [Mycena olivaceomarginata]|nr:hypothetical protein B0H14DRAFT_2614059 [Mycena olivaceomarginata]
MLKRAIDYTDVLNSKATHTHGTRDVEAQHDPSRTPDEMRIRIRAEQVRLWCSEPKSDADTERERRVKIDTGRGAGAGGSGTALGWQETEGGREAEWGKGDDAAARRDGTGRAWRGGCGRGRKGGRCGRRAVGEGAVRQGSEADKATAVLVGVADKKADVAQPLDPCDKVLNQRRSWFWGAGALL